MLEKLCFERPEIAAVSGLSANSVPVLTGFYADDLYDIGRYGTRQYHWVRYYGYGFRRQRTA